MTKTSQKDYGPMRHSAGHLAAGNSSVRHWIQEVNNGKCQKVTSEHAPVDVQVQMIWRFVTTLKQ